MCSVTLSLATIPDCSDHVEHTVVFGRHVCIAAPKFIIRTLFIAMS